jgi:hypothetical protein
VALATQLLGDLPGAVDTEIGVEDPLDLGPELLVPNLPR